MKNGKILNLTIIVFGLLLIHPLFVCAQDTSANLPRIMYWGGKVNQHWDINSKSWKSDSDGTSGSGIDILTYCKKYYPKTIGTEPYKEETISTWRSVGSGLYTSTRISFLCLQTVNKNSLIGKILIQTQDKGKAWYISPTDGKRYSLANGEAALKVMKSLNFGMEDADIVKIKTDEKFRKKYLGKVLYNSGEAYYISFDGRYNFLKDGATMMSIIKKYGQGISNANLNKITEYKAAVKVSVPVVSKSNASSTDLEISDLATSKLDSTICNTIKDHKLKGACLVKIEYKKGNKRPCEVLGNNYSELTDECKKLDLDIDKDTANQAVSKLDSTMCNTIYDHKTKGLCLAVIEFKRGTKHPCEVLGNNYPELADECKQLDAETNSSATPLARDTITISDVKLTQIALEMYYNDAGKYPTTINSGSPLIYQGRTYINAIPKALVGATSACLTNFQYTYTYISDNKYTLTYCIDGVSNASQGFSVGINTASQSGIR